MCLSYNDSLPKQRIGSTEIFWVVRKWTTKSLLFLSSCSCLAADLRGDCHVISYKNDADRNLNDSYGFLSFRHQPFLRMATLTRPKPVLDDTTHHIQNDITSGIPTPFPTHASGLEELFDSRVHEHSQLQESGGEDLGESDLSDNSLLVRVESHR